MIIHESFFPLGNACSVIQENDTIIPNAFGTRIYSPRSCWGRFWSFWYAVAGLLVDTTAYRNTRCTRFCTTMLVTAQRAREELDRLCQQASLMQRAPLNATRLSVHIAVLKAGAVLQSILQIEDMATPAEQLEKIDAFFHKYVGRFLFSDQEKETITQFQDVYALHVLESIVRAPVPVEVLHKLARNDPFSGEDTLVLDTWIRVVQDKSEFVSAALLHKALFSLFNGRYETLCRVEWRLYTKGLTQLMRASWEYRQAVFTLMPGASFHGVRLGEKLSFQGLIENHLCAFAVPGEAEKMVLIGKGETYVGIWHAYVRQIDRRSPIESVTMRLVNDGGSHYILAERPEVCADSIAWKTRYGEVAQTDRPLIEKIATLISYFAITQSCSRELRAKNLCIMKDGTLKALRPLIMDVKSTYARMLMLVKEVARNNFFVFKELVRLSRLQEHPVNQFFLHCTTNFFGTGDTSHNVYEEATKNMIQDQEVIEEANSMVNALFEMHQNLVSKLSLSLKEVSIPFVRLLRQAVAKAMIDFHNETGISCICWPGIVDDLELYVRKTYPQLF